MTCEMAKTHTLFRLTDANDGQLLIKMYTKLDITSIGLKVPNVDVLIVEDPNQMLHRNTRLSYLVL